MIFHCLLLENKQIKNRLISKPDGQVLMEIEKLCIKEKFTAIKTKLIKMNSIPVKNSIADFFGNEFILFVKHMDMFFKSYQVSECSNKYCSEPLRYIESASSILWFDTSTSLEQLIESIIIEKGTSKCSSKAVQGSYR